MIIGGYVSRGILCIIIGILHLVLAGLYIYYYRNNEKSTKKNRHKQLIFGPNSLITVELIIKIVSFIMYSVLAIAFLLSWKFDEHVSDMVTEACVNKTSLRDDIKSFISEKLN